MRVCCAPFLCLTALCFSSSSCATALPELGPNAPVRHTAEAPGPAYVGRVLNEDPFTETPPAPRMMHHGTYTAPVPGTDIVNDEAFPNEDRSQGMGAHASRAADAEPTSAPGGASEDARAREASGGEASEHSAADHEASGHKASGQP